MRKRENMLKNLLLSSEKKVQRVQSAKNLELQKKRKIDMKKVEAVKENRKKLKFLELENLNEKYFRMQQDEIRIKSLK